MDEDAREPGVGKIKKERNWVDFFKAELRSHRGRTSLGLIVLFEIGSCCGIQFMSNVNSFFEDLFMSTLTDVVEL